MTEYRRSWTAGSTAAPCRSPSSTIRLKISDDFRGRAFPGRLSSARESTRPADGLELAAGDIHLPHGKSPVPECTWSHDLILDKARKEDVANRRWQHRRPVRSSSTSTGRMLPRWYLLYASPAWSPTQASMRTVVIEVARASIFGTLRNVYNFFVLYSNAG